jgi:hypothetical protein
MAWVSMITEKEAIINATNSRKTKKLIKKKYSK